MTNDNPSERRWNIFARELETILAAHSLNMEQLESEVGISHQKVHRLIQSLSLPKSLPVLNPNEVKLLEQKLRLSYEEMLHLRASVLVTSIQRTLMDRLPQKNVLLVTEQIFPTILEALKKHAQEFIVHDPTKLGDGTQPRADDQFEHFFDSTWQTLDDAEMALQLSYNVIDIDTRVEMAHSAQTYFERASEKLEGAGEDIQALQTWQDCYTTSQFGLETANKRLKALGE